MCKQNYFRTVARFVREGETSSVVARSDWFFSERLGLPRRASWVVVNDLRAHDRMYEVKSFRLHDVIVVLKEMPYFTIIPRSGGE